MTIQAAIAQRDVRNIRDCEDIATLNAYEASAKARGIEQWETTAIAERRRELLRKGGR